MHLLANIDDDPRSRGGASSHRQHLARSDVDARTYDGADGRAARSDVDADDDAGDGSAPATTARPRRYSRS